MSVVHDTIFVKEFLSHGHGPCMAASLVVVLLGNPFAIFLCIALKYVIGTVINTATKYVIGQLGVHTHNNSGKPCIKCIP